MEAKQQQQQQQEDSSTLPTDAGQRVTPSNAASIVGRQICLLPNHNTKRNSSDTATDGEEGRKGVIVAYDPVSQQHTVRYLLDGSDSENETTKKQQQEEESLILNQHRFRWVVQQQPAEQETAQERMERAVKQDAVGRRLKIWSKKLQKWFDGTIVAYDADSDKHRIKFDLVQTLRRVRIEDEKWTYTDFVGGGRSPGAPCSLKTSKYMGVSRQSESRWSAFKGPMIPQRRIGTFASEKDAALAHDVFARREGRPVNFEKERVTETEMDNRKVRQVRHQQPETTNPVAVEGKSKFRGVFWNKKRERWMARYTLSHKGQKNINIGAFLDAKHAALAFDAEARRRGRSDSALNFPDERPTDEQIEVWKTNSASHSTKGSQKQMTSQYRGVSFEKKHKKYHVQININKVVQAMGGKKRPISVGHFDSETKAALAYDRACRQHGVPEKELNFPRNTPLAEVRLFDQECYRCFSIKPPTDPVATRCNHIFCRKCITEWLRLHERCPCCSTELTAQSAGLRSIKLIVPPELLVVSDHDDANDKADTDDTSESHDVAPPAAATAAATADGKNVDEQSRPADSVERNNDDAKPAAHDQLVESGAAFLDRPCRYPVGTRFMKEFEGEEKFEGNVTSFDGKHYHVHYPADGDEEDLSEDEFDDLEIIFRPDATDLKVVDGKAKDSSGNVDGAISAPLDEQQSTVKGDPLSSNKAAAASKKEKVDGTIQSDALPTNSKVDVLPSSPKEAAATCCSEKNGAVCTESKLQSKSEVKRSTRTGNDVGKKVWSAPSTSEVDSLSKGDLLPEQPRNGAASSSDCENHKVAEPGSEPHPGSKDGEMIIANASARSAFAPSPKAGSKVQSSSETVAAKKVQKGVDKKQSAASRDSEAHTVKTTRSQVKPDCSEAGKSEHGIAGTIPPAGTTRNQDKGRKPSGAVDDHHVEPQESLKPVERAAAVLLSESIALQEPGKHLTAEDNTDSVENLEDACDLGDVTSEEQNVRSGGAEMLTTSNAFSVVGSKISISLGKVNRDAVIMAYNPRTNEHTVRFDDDGKEMNFALNEQQFQWKVDPATFERDKKERLRRAVMRGAVGRRLKVWSEKNRKWLEGTIVGLNKKKDKHRIQFDIDNQVKIFQLDNEKWQYTDFIGTRALTATDCSLSSSKYMGVTRTGVSQWVAYEDPHCRGRPIGTFARERDAALAHDVVARKKGQQVNFKDERKTEDPAEQQERDSKDNRATLLESRGASIQPLDGEAQGANGKLNSLDRNAVQNGRNAEKSGNTEQPSAPRRNASSQYRSVISNQKDAKSPKSRQGKSAAKASSKGKASMNVPMPRYPIGTRFTKKFEGFGTFDGEVKDFDGEYYKVHYPADGDEEDLIESQLDSLTITFKPVVLPAVQVEKNKRGDDGEPSLSERSQSGKSSKSLKRGRTNSVPKEMSKLDKTVTSKQTKHTPTAASAHDTRIDTAGVDKSDMSAAEERSLRETDGMSSGTEQVQRSTGDFAQSVPATDHAGPRIALGTLFLKEFEGDRKYEGKVMSFDGDHYRIYYAEDSDEEEMSEWEFDHLEITHTPSSVVQPDSPGFNKKATAVQSSAAKTEASGEKRTPDRKKSIAVPRVSEQALVGGKSSSSANLHGAIIENKATESRPKVSVREDKTKSAEQTQVEGEKVETKKTLHRKKKQKSTGDSGKEEAGLHHPETKNQDVASMKDDESARLSQKGAATRQTKGDTTDGNVDKSSIGAHPPESSTRPRLPIGTCFVKDFAGYGLYSGRVIGFDGPNYRVCYEEVISEADMQNFELTDGPRPELKRRREESADDEKPKGKKKSKKAKRGNTRKHKEK